MTDLHPATLYRTQRLIRMGEWLEEHRSVLIALHGAIDDPHTDAIGDLENDRPSKEVILETLIDRQMEALVAMGRMLCQLRRNDWSAELGKDVTLHHPHACPKHKYQVVIKAPAQELEIEQ